MTYHNVSPITCVNYVSEQCSRSISGVYCCCAVPATTTEQILTFVNCQSNTATNAFHVIFIQLAHSCLTGRQPSQSVTESHTAAT